MMQLLIIEDEIPARNKLKRFIQALDTPVQIVAELDTVLAARQYLQQYPVDLIISDIELLDGNAFEIFQEVKITCPIIFTTAYDAFWMDAFESNGIAYLLKPFSQERFRKAWDKFILLTHADAPPSDLRHSLEQLTRLVQHSLEQQNTVQQSIRKQTYKQRFTVHSPQGIYFLDTANIVCFEADQSLITALDTDGRKHLLTASSLRELEDQLDPANFFRINRSQLVHKIHVWKIERYEKNTLAIHLRGQANSLKTSQRHTAAFRQWIGK